MANENTISIIINADGSAAVSGLGNVRGAMQGLENETKTLAGQLKTLAMQAAAAFGIYKIADAAKNVVSSSTMLAARVETLNVVLETVGRNAGYSSDQMQAFAKGVEKMGITTKESLDTVIRMTQAKMDLSKATELARVAQDAAVLGNINSSEALNKLVYGIQSAQVEVLKTIGINVSFEESYKRAAKEMGKTTDSLTEAEKANIRMNLVLEAGIGISGAYEAAMGTVGKQMTSLARYVEQAELSLGQLFKPALGIIIQSVTEKVKELQQYLSSATMSNRLQTWSEDFARGVNKAVSAAESFGKTVKTVISYAIDFKTELTAVGAAIATYYAASLVIAIVETGKLITAIKGLIAVLEILTYRAITAAVSKLGLLAMAIGGVVYLFAKMDEPGNTEVRIQQLEKLRAHLEKTGGHVADVNNQLNMLYAKRSKETGELPGYMPGAGTGGGDVPQKVAEVAQAAAESGKKIADLNKRIQDELDKMVMSSIELIQRQAREWEKEGADRVLVAKWVAEQVKKHEDEISLARQKNIQQDIEGRHRIEERLDQYRLKAEEISKVEETQNRFLREREALNQRLIVVVTERDQLARNAEVNEMRLNELAMEELNIKRELVALEQYEVYELQEQKKMNLEKFKDIAASMRSLESEMVRKSISNAMGGLPGSQEMGNLAMFIMETDWYSQQIQRLNEYHMQRLELIRNMTEEEVAIRYNGLSREAAMEAETANRGVEISRWEFQQKMAMTSSLFGTLGGIAQNFYTASGQRNKAAFSAYKAFATASAIVSTIAAAVDAMQQEKSPWWAKLIAMAAVLAAGYAQVSRIQSTEIGGSSSASSTGYSGGGITYPSTPYKPTVPDQAAEKQPESKVINIYIQGHVVDNDKFARELLPSLLKASEDGVR